MRNLLFLLTATALLIQGCSKKDTYTAPQLADVRVVASGVNTAIVENQVLARNINAIVAAGTCWSSKERQPTLENCEGHTTAHPASDGRYTDSLNGLRYNTKYYLRAYATDGTGNSYGTVDSFFTLQTPFPPGTQAKGGIVLSVDSTGMHGLIVAGPQYVVYRPWANSFGLIGGTHADFGSGPANTLAIIAGSNNDPGTAAAYCHNLQLSGYDDWFLPSYEELYYFRNNMSFGQWLSYGMDMYWCSSEASSTEAYFVVIGGIASFNTYDKMIGKSVLPMRRF